MFLRRSIFSLLVLTAGFLSFGNSAQGQHIKALNSENVFGQEGGRTLLTEKVEVYDYNKKGRGCKSDNPIRCVIERAINYFKILLVPVVILTLTWSGAYLLVVRTKEEEYKKRINEILAVLAGLAIIALAVTIVDRLFFGAEGDILTSGAEVDFAQEVLVQIQGLIKFMLSFVVPLAILFLVLSAFQLIFAGGDEESIGKVKKRIIYTVVGIVVIIASERIVGTFADERRGIETPEVLALLNIGTGWLNYLLSFVAVLAVLAIVWAGILMVVHFGDDERVETAKNTIKYAVIGLVVAFSAWSIVRFFLTAGV